jgi:ferredoxin
MRSSPSLRQLMVLIITFTREVIGMKIRINERKCQGFGMCANAAPDLFAVGEHDGYAYLKIDSADAADGIGHLRMADIPKGSEEAATAAVSICPMEAIETLDP